MLTPFQKQKLPLLFAVHDLNQDGVINRSDFEEYSARIAKTRGWGRDSAEYKQLVDRFMTFWNGLEEVARRKGARQVTVKEWLEDWDEILANPRLYDQIVPPIGRAIFTMLDQDGDGQITAKEYAITFKQGGLDEKDAAAAFERLDLNHDGRLSSEEFITLAEQFFRSNDAADPGNALFGVLPALQTT
jgi:Ca2+-binding EF-hand superfamily protein